MKYKLNEPEKKPLSDRLPFYLFAAILSVFMLWIMLIRPMTLPADKMPFIFVKDPAHNSQSQKTQYFLLTAGPILMAGLFMIPTVRNGNRHDYALAKLWANREYLDDGEFSELCDMLKPNIIKDNGANRLLAELQKRVDKHEGKHITGRKYFKKEFVKDLQPYGKTA